MLRLYMLAVLMTNSILVFAQSLAINTDGSTAHVSAILDVKSTDKGVLIPRLTNLQKLAIPFVSLTTGLLVYDIDEETFSFFNGFQWRALNNAVGGNLWQQNGTHIYNTNTGNVGIGTFFPAGKLHVADESVFFTAPLTALSGTTNIGITGEGLRSVWFPARAAFRAGGVTGVNAAFWDRDSIGDYSTAFGLNVKAKGFSSFAQGNFVQAIGDYSFATGTIARANGINSIAMGLQTTANGDASVAIGTGVTTNGAYSFSSGYATIANGDNSTAIGLGVSALSFGETAVGAYNTNYSPASTTAWSASDRVFTVGNGSSFASPSNALTILKNGNTGIGIADPSFRLDVNGRMRIKSGGSDATSAGIWFNNNANSVLAGFAGMANDNYLGFYGNSGAGWGLNMNTTNGNVGVGTLTPTQKLEVNGKIKITDGTQAAGRILVSDATGTGTWTNNIAITPAVQGVFAGGGVSFGNGTPSGSSTGWFYAVTYIDLPAGKWMIFGTYLLNGALPSDAGVFVRTTLSDNNTGAGTCSPDVISGCLLSGTLMGPVGFSIANGQMVINNTSGGTKRYYMWASMEKFGTTPTAFSINAIGSSFWSENQLTAIPMN